MINICFKEWLHLTEKIFLEGFNEKKQQFISQGIEEVIVDRYLDWFKEIKDKNYKQLRDNIHGVTVPENKRNDIDAYPDFHQLEILVDYVRGQVDVKGAQFKEIKVDAEPIFQNDKVQIFYADTPRACITYKGNIPYSWCVARSDSSNLFYAYRYKQHEPAFYFVKSKERTQKEFQFWNSEGNKFTGQFKDKYHFIVIQVILGAKSNDLNAKQYVVTSAMNDGDIPMSWNEILRIMPELSGLESKIAHVPISDEDRAFYNKYKYGISDEDFAKLDYAQKSKFMDVFVGLDEGLSDNQFAVLPNDLKNKYIGFSVGLTDEQYKLIESDRKLLKRYEDVTLEKIKSKIDFKLKPSEIKIFLKHPELINELTDASVSNLLKYATNKDEIINIIINYKKELSDDNIHDLLENASEADIHKIQNIILNYKELNYNTMLSLLRFSGKNKTEIADEIINRKKELTSKEVEVLLNSMFNADEDTLDISKKIIKNKKELTNMDVEVLIYNSSNKYETAKLIINNKKELTDNNVYFLLEIEENKDEIKRLLREKGITVD